MLPKFRRWIEEQEEPQPQQGQESPEGQDNSNLSEPQHKKGESFMPLNKVMEKRILEIIEEFKLNGKASEEQVLNSIKYFLDNKIKNAQPQQGQPQQGQPQQGQPQQGQPQQGQPQQDQAAQPQQGQPQQGSPQPQQGAPQPPTN